MSDNIFCNLIQHVIGDDYAFYVAGMNNVSMRMQLKNFMQGIRKKKGSMPLAESWLDAFIALEDYPIATKGKGLTRQELIEKTSLSDNDNGQGT